MNSRDLHRIRRLSRHRKRILAGRTIDDDDIAVRRVAAVYRDVACQAGGRRTVVQMDQVVAGTRIDGEIGLVVELDRLEVVDGNQTTGSREKSIRVSACRVTDRVVTGSPADGQRRCYNGILNGLKTGKRDRHERRISSVLVNQSTIAQARAWSVDHFIDRRSGCALYLQ